jgi:hypothetical protein
MGAQAHGQKASGPTPGRLPPATMIMDPEKPKMAENITPPDDNVQIRCPRLGHQINFSYCRHENFALPCPRSIVCWQQYFPVAAYLRQELTPGQWQDTFGKPPQDKILSLVELIEQAQQRQKDRKE